MAKKIIFSKDQIKFIVKDYNNGKGISKIASAYNVSTNTIMRLLKENEVTISKRKHIFNQNVFEKVDTPTKAYWLGFILADGYIHEKRGFLRIKLQEQDKNHLYKFVDFISGDYGMIKSEHHNITNNLQYYVDANSRKLIDDLIKLNIRQRKSSGKEQLSKIPYHLIKDYIRGIWDGDGNIRPKNINLISSIEVLQFVQKYLSENCYTNLTNICNHCNTYRIFICKNRNIVLNHLYYDGCISLKRKYDLARHLVNDYINGRPKSTVA